VVTYWDTSALIPLLLKEATSESYRKIARETEIVTWWGAAVECASGIERRVREGEPPEKAAAAYRNLNDLLPHWREIHPSESLRRSAIRLLRTHRLRAADALHVAAATVASDFAPTTARFLTADARLKVAAEREGFLIG
jgi:predicted nucleic acid-binding protein